MLKDLSLCMLGDLLNPKIITEILNVTPRKARLKNEQIQSVSKKVIYAKTGAWSWDATSTPELSFDDQVAQFYDVFHESIFKLAHLPNVSNIWLDFCLIDDNTKGYNSFSLSAESLAIISKTGLQTKFTVYNRQGDAE
jgi:hypothetical protein